MSEEVAETVATPQVSEEAVPTPEVSEEPASEPAPAAEESAEAAPAAEVAEGPVRTEGQALKGTIKSWLCGKGYGFIAVDDGGHDLFVHNTALQVEGEIRAVLPETEVTFTFSLRKGKETATEVAGVAGKLPGFKSMEDADRQIRAKKEGKLPGTTKWMDPRKGFGFIVPDDGGPEVFVHVDQIEDHLILEEGEPVLYKTEINEAGKEGQKLRAAGVVSLARDAYGFYTGRAPPKARNARKDKDGNAFSTGTVKMFVETKGFGFIIPEGGGEDVFVHINNIEYQEPLVAGDRVSYITEKREGQDKLQAVQVVIERPVPETMRGGGYGGPPPRRPYYDDYYGGRGGGGYGGPPRGPGPYKRRASEAGVGGGPGYNKRPAPGGGYGQQRPYY